MSTDGGEAAKNLKAFLRLIRWAEFYPGGGTDRDYRTLYGGGQFTGFADHPRQKITKWGKISTAAGAYMILEDTFDGYKKKLGLRDFTPASQDRIAVDIIKSSHALNLVEAGQIAEAIAKLLKQWTSLPGASQSRIKLQEALDQFSKFKAEIP